MSCVSKSIQYCSSLGYPGEHPNKDTEMKRRGREKKRKEREREKIQVEIETEREKIGPCKVA